MKCSLDISYFLEEISSLSHSVLSLYFFALITEEGFLISPCYSLDLDGYWKWQLTPVILPRKFHGWRSLAGYSPWGRKELNMTERLHSYSPMFPFLLCLSLLFSAICKASSYNHFAFLHFFVNRFNYLLIVILKIQNVGETKRIEFLYMIKVMLLSA